MGQFKAPDELNEAAAAKSRLATMVPQPATSEAQRAGQMMQDVAANIAAAIAKNPNAATLYRGMELPRVLGL